MTENGRSRHFRVIIERDAEANAWVSYVPTLGLSTYGDTRDEALEQTREAIVGYLEAAAKESLPIPSADAQSEVVDMEVVAP